MPSRKRKAPAAEAGTEDAPEMVPAVTYRDHAYRRRPIQAGGQRLQVDNGRVTTDDAAAQADLDARHEFTREG